MRDVTTGTLCSKISMTHTYNTQSDMISISVYTVYVCVFLYDDECALSEGMCSVLSGVGLEKFGKKNRLLQLQLQHTHQSTVIHLIHTLIHITPQYISSKKALLHQCAVFPLYCYHSPHCCASL